MDVPNQGASLFLLVPGRTVQKPPPARSDGGIKIAPTLRQVHLPGGVKVLPAGSDSTFCRRGWLSEELRAAPEVGAINEYQQKFSLDGQIAMVTGAAAGIGRGIAELFASARASPKKWPPRMFSG